MSGVNHQRAIKGRLVCQLGEDPAENTEPAPPDEPIVQRLVRTIFRGSILPLKSMFDKVKNAADDVPVIGTGDTVRAGKERAEPFHLAFGKVKQGNACDTSMSSVYPVFTSLGIMSPDPSINMVFLLQ